MTSTLFASTMAPWDTTSSSTSKPIPLLFQPDHYSVIHQSESADFIQWATHEFVATPILGVTLVPLAEVITEANFVLEDNFFPSVEVDTEVSLVLGEPGEPELGTKRVKKQAGIFGWIIGEGLYSGMLLYTINIRFLIMVCNYV
jgi:hypothetical protein